MNPDPDPFAENLRHAWDTLGDLGLTGPGVDPDEVRARGDRAVDWAMRKTVAETPRTPRDIVDSAAQPDTAQQIAALRPGTTVNFTYLTRTDTGFAEVTERVVWARPYGVDLPKG